MWQQSYPLLEARVIKTAFYEACMISTAMLLYQYGKVDMRISVLCGFYTSYFVYKLFKMNKLCTTGKNINSPTTACISLHVILHGTYDYGSKVNTCSIRVICSVIQMLTHGSRRTCSY